VIDASTEQYSRAIVLNYEGFGLLANVERSRATLPTSLGSLGLELERRLTWMTESFLR
jgi:hypothetical protein